MNQSILTNSRELILIIEFCLYEEAFALLIPQELLHARFSSGWTCCAELLWSSRKHNFFPRESFPMILSFSRFQTHRIISFSWNRTCLSHTQVCFFLGFERSRVFLYSELGKCCCLRQSPVSLSNHWINKLLLLWVTLLCHDRRKSGPLCLEKNERSHRKGAPIPMGQSAFYPALQEVNTGHCGLHSKRVPHKDRR